MNRGTGIALAACLLAAAIFPAAAGPSGAAGAVSISIDNPQNGTVIYSELNISGTASGPEGQELAVSVSIDGGQHFPARGNTSWTYRWSPAVTGQHTIEATAIAGNETATAQVLVNYSLPQPKPKIGGHDPSSTELSLAPGENLTLSVTLSGPAIGTVVRWYENGSELTGEAGNLKINLTTPDDLAGTITVEARLTQNGTATDSIRWNITLANPQRPPRIVAFWPEQHNISLAPEEVVQFNVTASDPDGDELNITWLVDGEPSASGINMSSFETKFNRTGDHCITVSVSDGHGTVDVTWNLTVENSYILGFLDIAPCIVYIVLGLLMGVWYGTRTRRTPGPRAS